MTKWTKIAIVLGASVALGGSVGLGVYSNLDRNEQTTITFTTPTMPPVADHILTIWDWDNTKALLTNIKGDVGDINWGNTKYVSGATHCSIEHENKIFLLGQVSHSRFLIF